MDILLEKFYSFHLILVSKQNRKLLFSYKSAGQDKKNIDFEISKSRHMYIDYVIPPAEEGSFIGCVVFAVGYK